MKIRWLNLADRSETVVQMRAEMSDDGAPKWNRLFPVGLIGYRPDFPSGKIEFTRDFLASMVRNWERLGKPAKQVNYLHRGESGGDDLPVDQKIAAGWIEDLQLRDDGLYGLIRWTDKARGFIQRDELRYLSPEFHPNAFDKLTGKSQGPTLFGCALLNDPYLEPQERVAAANNPNAARAAGAQKMDKAKLIALLALADTATDAEIEKALTEQKAKLAEMETKLSDATSKLDLANKGSTEMVQLRAANETLQQQVKLANERIAAIETERKNAEIDTYLAERVKAGVLTPAMTPGVKALAESAGLPAVKAIYDNAPVVQALGEKGRSGDATPLDADKAHGEFVALMDKAEKDGIDPSAAFNRIIRERPDLAKFAGKLSH